MVVSVRKMVRRQEVEKDNLPKWVKKLALLPVYLPLQDKTRMFNGGKEGREKLRKYEWFCLKK